MKRNRLLIIDDDPLICKTLEHIAQKAGFEVMSTDSAFSFFSQLELFDPSLIIVDLIMPEISGTDLMLRMAKLHTEAKLIITSGQDSSIIEAAEMLAKKNGLSVLGILKKPFSAANLKYLLTLHLSHFDKTTNSERWEDAPHNSEWTPSLEEIIRVIEDDEITLNFQPKLSASDGDLLGFEALARWNVPGRGQITPSLFIPLAERNHLYSVMTKNIARKGINWLGKLNKLNTTDSSKPTRSYGLAFNITINALYDHDLPEQFLELCNEFEVAPNLITLEVSEPDSITDLDEFINALERFSKLGFHLSLDDFGTGHMAIRELVRSPFHEVKIDKKFVAICDKSQEAKAIVKCCIDIAKNLNLKVIAEGIETQEIRDFVEAEGCYAVQGYLISKPLQEEQVLAWMQDNTNF